MYPIDWLVNLLSPTQWVAVGIVLALVCAVLYPILIFRTYRDANDVVAWVMLGIITPLILSGVVATVFHFVSFLVWLWIGAPGA